MDFIHDQFITLEDKHNSKYYVSAGAIVFVIPTEIDECSVMLSTGNCIHEVKMPAPVLVQKIGQIREAGRRRLGLR